MPSRRAETAGRDVLTLLLARVEGMHAVADQSTPEGLGRLLRDILSTCEAAVGAVGGEVVQWDPSDVAGSRILCAWPPESATPGVDFRTVAQGIRSGIRAALRRGAPADAPPTRVTVVVCRGECTWARAGPRFTFLVGTTINRCHELCRGGPGGDPGDAVRIDASVPPPA